MVREVGVIDEEVGKLAFEQTKVGKQQIHVEVDEHLLEGAFRVPRRGFLLGSGGEGRGVPGQGFFMDFAKLPANSGLVSVTKQGSDEGGFRVSAERGKNVWTNALRNCPVCHEERLEVANASATGERGLARQTMYRRRPSATKVIVSWAQRSGLVLRLPRTRTFPLRRTLGFPGPKAATGSPVSSDARAKPPRTHFRLRLCFDPC